jgi:hypothetical protein
MCVNALHAIHNMLTTFWKYLMRSRRRPKSLQFQRFIQVHIFDYWCIFQIFAPRPLKSKTGPAVAKTFGSILDDLNYSKPCSQTTYRTDWQGQSSSSSITVNSFYSSSSSSHPHKVFTFSFYVHFFVVLCICNTQASGSRTFVCMCAQ